MKTTVIKKRQIPRIFYIAIAGISLYFATQLFHPSTSAESICEAATNLQRISCGQHILLTPPDGGKSQPNKISGFDAFKQKNYDRAIDFLTKDWQLTQDPESLIVLNNATILRDRPTTVKTIAVITPRSGTPAFVATNLLKGVAAAQQEWNQKSSSWKLLVAIADDNNDPDTAKQISAELVKHQDVLAVLGHYSSTVTVEVKDIYQQAKTVLLSATSTADSLSNLDEEAADNYFFRVVGTTKTSATHLAQKWATYPGKIALFYTPNKKFSSSFRKAFFAKVPVSNIVKEFDLTNRNNAESELALAKAAGAQTIVIIPDAFTTANERERVFAIIRANQGQMPILGASIVRDAYLFKFTPVQLKNLVITIPVHPTDRQFIDETRLSKAPNWWGAKDQVHDRIIDSYDGMQVLLAALDKSSDRQTVRKTIATAGFNVRGITGKISFQGSDRAEKIDSLVTPTSCDETKCNFQVVN